MRYICSVCSFVYDEAKGIPGEFEPGTKWEDIDENWVCPICGASKSEFYPEEVKAEGEKAEPKKSLADDEDVKELSAVEVAALCENLARGCEKQYKAEEAELFTKLAKYFKDGLAAAKEDTSFTKLLELVDEDLNSGFVNAEEISKEKADRGALRALTWSGKVSRILKSLLGRYESVGDEMLKDTGVYVCTVCGFIYVGKALPDLCPVCKVANWKFEEIRGDK